MYNLLIFKIKDTRETWDTIFAENNVIKLNSKVDNNWNLTKIKMALRKSS
jgi:hypothetical protein